MALRIPHRVGFDDVDRTGHEHDMIEYGFALRLVEHRREGCAGHLVTRQILGGNALLPVAAQRLRQRSAKLGFVSQYEPALSAAPRMRSRYLALRCPAQFEETIRQSRRVVAPHRTRPEALVLEGIHGHGNLLARPASRLDRREIDRGAL